jgi:hypothetical protein
MSKQFAGIFENTSIHQKMRKALGFVEQKGQPFRGSANGQEKP